MTTETLTVQDARPERPERPGYRYYVLAVLILIYMLNFLDRQIIGILAAPLKAEFGLSDAQFGLETMCVGGGQGVAAMFERR